MNAINARPHLNVPLLALLLSLGHAALFAQPVYQESYKIKVILNSGERLYGLIDYLTDSTLTVANDTERASFSSRGAPWNTVAFTDIKRVIVKRTSKKRSRISGAIVGGLLAGFAEVATSQKNQFRSPSLAIVNTILATGAGALIGMVAGHLVGNTSRFVIRPAGSDPETINRSIRLRLEPFLYDAQQRLMKNQ
ncbi:hypothetical protein [Fibrella aquatilis]|uniref:Uncharacterized protein n=1 Tax=Fibrella aquatilis TaxID=2817059 RepID=A0A939G4I3_9BACT|nr:hypothetical protein [Fibrella aquatilis]MBO0931063.1 hypothetical protein [Fibrella aquatilis]